MGIFYNIFHTRMVMHTHVIILEELKTYSLENIQLFLGENILKDIMVCERIDINNKQLVSQIFSANTTTLSSR